MMLNDVHCPNVPRSASSPLKLFYLLVAFLRHKDDMYLRTVFAGSSSIMKSSGTVLLRGIHIPYIHTIQTLHTILFSEIFIKERRPPPHESLSVAFMLGSKYTLQSLLFDLLKSFDQIENSHKLDFCFSVKTFSFMCAHYVLVYNLLLYKKYDKNSYLF